jgi:hypothetical protein
MIEKSLLTLCVSRPPNPAIKRARNAKQSGGKGSPTDHIFYLHPRQYHHLEYQA